MSDGRKTVELDIPHSATERAKRKDARIAKLEALVSKQAEDEGLWFVPVSITEDYLQRALRALHEAIEGGEG
jgi:hypothetical protein